MKETRAAKIAELWLEMQKHGLPPPELSALHRQGFSPFDPAVGAVEDENLNGCSIM